MADVWRGIFPVLRMADDLARTCSYAHWMHREE